MIQTNFFSTKIFSRVKPIAAIVLLVLSGALLAWSLDNYKPTPSFYGPRAIYSLVFLSVVLGLLGRFTLLQLLKAEHHQQSAAWRSLFLLDITAPLYLAANVLIGLPASVITVLFTQIAVQGYTCVRGFASWSEGCYRIASTTLLVLVSGIVYVWIAGSALKIADYRQYTPLIESREFLGSILAAVVMMFLMVLVSLPILAKGKTSRIYTAWRMYANSPVFGFQILVLSVGTLLPVVDIFDNVAGELAWLFFLVPLFAIYYLALSSTRLSIRTDELNHTLQNLNSARRRQDELRGYASLVTQVQEEERRRLARELHDDTAQALIALSLGLNGLERILKRVQLPEKDLNWLKSLQNLADRTLDGVRRACRDLRPSVLDDLGLHAALEWLCDSCTERNVPCTFVCTGDAVPTSSESEIAIFRIVQEALSNIMRHAEARHVDVELEYLSGLLRVKVNDDGKGFDLDESDAGINHNSRGGLGILGMRERAELIGAKLQITTSPRQGCSLVLSLPLH
jgi:signal transduction histidine kinase